MTTEEFLVTKFLKNKEELVEKVKKACFQEWDRQVLKIKKHMGDEFPTAEFEKDFVCDEENDTMNVVAKVQYKLGDFKLEAFLNTDDPNRHNYSCGDSNLQVCVSGGIFGEQPYPHVWVPNEIYLGRELFGRRDKFAVS